MRKTLFTLTAFFFSVNVMAADNIQYSCTLNGAERVIEVVYPTAGKKLPCEVHYTKDGQTEVLWTYQNELDKCEAQAASFAEKQATWGWQCSTTSAAADSSAE